MIHSPGNRGPYEKDPRQRRLDRRRARQLKKLDQRQEVFEEFPFEWEDFSSSFDELLSQAREGIKTYVVKDDMAELFRDLPDFFNRHDKADEDRHGDTMPVFPGISNFSLPTINAQEIADEVVEVLRNVDDELNRRFEFIGRKLVEKAESLYTKANKAVDEVQEFVVGEHRPDLTKFLLGRNVESNIPWDDLPWKAGVEETTDESGKIVLNFRDKAAFDSWVDLLYRTAYVDGIRDGIDKQNRNDKK